MEGKRKKVIRSVQASCSNLWLAPGDMVTIVEELHDNRILVKHLGKFLIIPNDAIGLEPTQVIKPYDKKHDLMGNE